MPVSAWSTDNASNSTVGSINIAENCAPGNLNDAIREVMAQLATFFAVGSGGGISVTGGGTGATTAAQALINLGAAASGANADITSLAGLTSAIPGSGGGTGLVGVNSSVSPGINGYFKTYSGIILQWGTVSVGNGNPTQSVTVNFPATFPNTAWFVVGSPNGGSNSGWAQLIINFPVLNQVGFGMNLDSGQSGQGITAGRLIRWFAIGN